MVGNGMMPLMQCGSGVGEEHEVIAVADVRLALQGVFYEHVEVVQIHVGPMLARQVPNRQPARPCKRQQVVPREEHRCVAPGENARTADKYLVDQPQGGKACHMAFNLPLQDGMVNRWEELTNVGLQDIWIPPGERLCTVDGSVGSLVLATGIGIVDEAGLEDRLNDVYQCMMHDAVAIRRGADRALLALTNDERAVCSRDVILR